MDYKIINLLGKTFTDAEVETVITLLENKKSSNDSVIEIMENKDSTSEFVPLLTPEFTDVIIELKSVMILSPHYLLNPNIQSQGRIIYQIVIPGQTFCFLL